jgi:hypothetical protein
MISMTELGGMAPGAVGQEDSMKCSIRIAWLAVAQIGLLGAAAPDEKPSAEKASPPALKDLAGRLTKLLKTACPEATVALDGDELRARYRTQTFLVHGRGKDGTYAEDAHKEEGPNKGGFLLTLYFRATDEPGQLAMPQDLQETYWTSYVNKYAIGSGADAGFVWARLSSNAWPSKELLAEIKKCFAEAGPRTKRRGKGD